MAERTQAIAGSGRMQSDSCCQEDKPTGGCWVAGSAISRPGTLYTGMA
jgi:hypothetical protein